MHGIQSKRVEVEYFHRAIWRKIGNKGYHGQYKKQQKRRNALIASPTALTPGARTQNIILRSMAHRRLPCAAFSRCTTVHCYGFTLSQRLQLNSWENCVWKKSLLHTQFIQRMWRRQDWDKEWGPMGGRNGFCCKAELFFLLHTTKITPGAHDKEYTVQKRI